MTQFRRILNLTAVLALLALPALAQDRAPIARAEGRAFPFLRCLRAADLSDAQKADIKAIMEAARPLLQAAHEKVRADRQKLHADLEAGADKSVIGQDVINLHADMKAARAELESVKEQVVSKLTAEQKAKVGDCFEGHKRGHMREDHFEGHFD
jgi:Spy/CpxP family protein refolding chaperone